MTLMKSEQANPERLFRLFDRAARLAQAAEQAAGLPPVQWQILRYLNKANRFSRSPSALAAYLGLTRGTLSQSVKALEARSLVRRRSDPADRRAVILDLSEAGIAFLAQDPGHLTRDAMARPGKKERRRFGEALEALLAAQIEASGLKSYGTCRECRHWQAELPGRQAAGPHRCDFFAAPLSDAESGQICRAQEAPSR